jgi:hypothetical protein
VGIKRMSKDEVSKDKEERISIAMFCTDEDSSEYKEEIRQKVLLKLEQKPGRRGSVVMLGLNDEDLTKIDSLVWLEVF